jgi:hypothetical protein
MLAFGVAVVLFVHPVAHCVCVCVWGGGGLPSVRSQRLAAMLVNARSHYAVTEWQQHFKSHVQHLKLACRDPVSVSRVLACGPSPGRAQGSDGGSPYEGDVAAGGSAPTTSRSAKSQPAPGQGSPGHGGSSGGGRERAVAASGSQSARGVGRGRGTCPPTCPPPARWAGASCTVTARLQHVWGCLFPCSRGMSQTARCHPHRIAVTVV